LFLDLETTGLKIEEHEILEIAAISTDLKLNELDRFVVKTLPEHIENADPKALEVTKYDRDLWKEEGIPLIDGLKKLLRLTPYGCFSIPVGHNIKTFDVPFIRKECVRLGLFCNLSYHLVDTVDLAVAYQIASGKKLPNVRLATITEVLGIKHEDAHTAMCDVEANLEVFKELVGLMRLGYRSLEQ